MTEPTVTTALERIERMLAEITPGKWESEHAIYPYDGPHQGKMSRAIYARPTENHVVEIIESPDELYGECIHNEADWTFIASAPEMVRLLVGVAKAAKEYADRCPCVGLTYHGAHTNRCIAVREALAALAGAVVGGVKP